MDNNSRIYVAGHSGLVGSAIVRKLISEGFSNIIVRDLEQLDLTNQQSVYDFFNQVKPEYVFLAAAKVGGIWANNTYPADFIMENLLIECNIIQAAWRYGAKKLLFLGSSCIYPKDCPQPMKEEYLLTGLLEPTNEAYALAKIAGLKMCLYFNKQYGTRFVSCMPTNLYGPNDNYDLNNSHVLPAQLRKIHEAKLEGKPYVEVWGSGSPLREFMHVDDMADACLFLMEHYEENEHINIGSGEEVSIQELVEIIKEVVGYDGDVMYNPSKPDGTPRKLLDASRLNGMGWKRKISLKEGITNTYQHYCDNYSLR